MQEARHRLIVRSGYRRVHLVVLFRCTRERGYRAHFREYFRKKPLRDEGRRSARAVRRLKNVDARGPGVLAAYTVYMCVLLRGAQPRAFALPVACIITARERERGSSPVCMRVYRHKRGTRAYIEGLGRVDVE